MSDTALVVACMGEGVSTPWGYGCLDELHGNFADVTDGEDPRAARIVEAMKNDAIFDTCGDFYNIFEEVVPNVQPHVNRLKELMAAGGARRAMMSGSGPSVFGVFETIEAAMEVCERLNDVGAQAFVCHPRPKYRT